MSLIIAMSAAVFLNACGIKHDLYIPAQDSAATSAEEAAE